MNMVMSDVHDVYCFRGTDARFGLLQCNPIPGFEEANMFLENGNVLHFKNPKGMSLPFLYHLKIIGAYSNV